jgi:hypothetical protein
MSEGKRPIGVTFVGILYLLMSFIAFLGAIGFFVWAGIAPGGFTILLPNAPIWLDIGGTMLLTFLGLAIFIVAVIDLLIAVGCFRGWGWIWTWALLFCLLNIFFAMFNAFGQSFTLNAVWIGLMASIIPIIVIFYLNTRKVKMFFGKVRDIEIQE